ncbi:hypothetical protein IFT73_00915 [Aeromicrobium sp. CFBP 8757]|uniref:hypothetical protein n=1 Tax=Aeromicrobium sp. CFBP 8757 TaxID=2775288 RepID=UPI00177D2811|nr:hypothetical protein [Aeromicrobium sp. CFBP 8757]MBD8605399.1 hypothetical protein [Aeromicrobium sp. CFBP 8757]
MPSSDEVIVEALLHQHGLTVPADELALLVGAYPGKRAAVQALRALDGVRYEEPAVTFDPRV